MKHTTFVPLLVFSCLFNFLLPVAGWTAPTGYQEISAPELKTMLEEKKCLLVHSLSKIEYEIQHIKGSINIPVIDMDTTTLLPKDKTIPLIFYCMGTR